MEYDHMGDAGAISGRSATRLIASRQPPVEISLKDVSFGWHHQPAVCHVTGIFAPGSMTAIMGPNGAGKSTLIKGIMGMLSPMTGKLSFSEGQSTHADSQSNHLAWLPQAADCDRSFPVTVYDFVAMGAWRRVGAWRHFGKGERGQVLQALDEVNMAHLHDAMIGALSGGQWQRVLFARLILQDAAVLLLDEPFNAVDPHTINDLMQLLQAYHAQGRTVIAVLHDMMLVRAYFPQTLLLSGHVVAWGQTVDILTEANLRMARTGDKHG